ncbi:NADP-dependent oxidoreductase domain-containing protein [Hypoxylon trugodes]|uniref:NADP-dependent oxidoreductase domain-containing protein n=1 Tax=Hypoxylon trugodes TaxID=326681 RepID=UPI002194E588|nr:NADP-dependent oxidoreductase domain-containing protein [Hypoxylon trugodes]KAI1390434.1 NADP-dependent oxidoreductase domain-containing protein [Hypoxylon trugodes]
MASQRFLTLNTGYRMPAVGLGTWLSQPDEVKRAVTAALKTGYRHVDSAAAYGNEKQVGEGIKASGVPRKEIFITSKLWNTHHAPEDVEEAVDKSLSDLQLDYLDLYLIHWPVAYRKSNVVIQPLRSDGYIDIVDSSLNETWSAMEKLVQKGKVRSIGVSNFTVSKIQDLMKTLLVECRATIKPAVNQIEAHPYLQQRDLLGWCKKEGIVITAYSPLGNNIYNFPRVVDDPLVISIAEKLGKSPAQVLISWAVQRGTSVLPKSVTPARIENNYQDFELSQDDFDAIQSLERHQRNNFPTKIGLDIFGELGDEVAKAKADEWVKEQKALNQQ